jgi:hypothetical protein
MKLGSSLCHKVVEIAEEANEAVFNMQGQSRAKQPTIGTVLYVYDSGPKWWMGNGKFNQLNQWFVQ